MQTWKWLYKPETSFNWRFIRNVIIKTLLLFVAANAIFALLDPLPTLGKLTGYNWLFTGRERLPYGENPAAAYNLSLYQVDAMFASHKISAANDDEFRVVLIGDSSTWGILLTPEETLAGQLNAQNLIADGMPIHVYNLGYPTMSLTKDLMLLDYAMRYDPDLIVWLFTLESFDREGQINDSALIQNNPDRMQPLIRTYNLDLNPDNEQFVELSLWDKTIIKQRRALADLLRLQYYGVAWSLTGIDQDYPDYKPRAVDFEADETWRGFNPGMLSESDLAFDLLEAGQQIAGDTALLFINEPMMISDGANSDLRYNTFYPRWAYDTFREWLNEHSTQNQWLFVDLWDRLPQPECYTDSAVHLTPECSAQLAAEISPIILQTAADDPS